MTVIVAVGFVNRQHCPHAGQYLEWFDFDYANGLGRGEFTKDRTKALEFKDAGEAMTFWKTVSRVKPFRADGKPNRPLTALTVEIK
jgi:hypothetical protein